MATNAAAAVSRERRVGRREMTQARAVRRFKWSVLGVFIALMVGMLGPVLFLLLHFDYGGEQDLIAIVDGVSSYRAGTELGVRFTPEHLFLFGEDGRRLGRAR